MSGENRHLKVARDIEPQPLELDSTGSGFRVVTPIEAGPDEDAPCEFEPARRWSARMTTLFVVVCSAGLWALIIWGALRFLG